MAKKIERVSPNPGFQKRYEQNMRILREFPWLWGVRNQWAFVYDKLSVSKADDELTRFLNQEMPDQAIEVWAYFRRICIQYQVERIEWRDHTPEYGVRIGMYFHSPEDLEYIVLVRNVEGGDGVVAPNHTKAHIYRPRKGELLSEFIKIAPAAVLS